MITNNHVISVNTSYDMTPIIPDNQRTWKNPTALSSTWSVADAGRRGADFEKSPNERSAAQRRAAPLRLPSRRICIYL